MLCLPPLLLRKKTPMPSISGGIPAGIVALSRVFDLDDLRAQVAQHHGADCAGQEAGEVEDAGGVEGFHAGLC